MRKKREKNLVQLQNVRVRDNAAAYWEYSFKRNRINDDGEMQESVLSNPDSLGENVLDCFKRGAQSVRAWQILEAAVQTLTGKQLAVYTDHFRNEKTQQTIADELGISHQSVAKLLNRAKANIVKYCREHWSELNEGA